VSRALKAESDGKDLRRDLRNDIKKAVEPGVSKVQGKLRAMPHSSTARSSPALGSYLASRTKAAIKLTGRSTGVAVRIPQTPNIRGFKLAARRLNRKSWRHKVFGNPRLWVTQQSRIPGYFDDTLADGKAAYKKAVVEALEKMARRIAERA
jgi:hypothetical protein